MAVEWGSLLGIWGYTAGWEQLPVEVPPSSAWREKGKRALWGGRCVRTPGDGAGLGPLTDMHVWKGWFSTRMDGCLQRPPELKAPRPSLSHHVLRFPRGTFCSLKGSQVFPSLLVIFFAHRIYAF